MPSLKHIYRLGIKELWSLVRDPMMLFLIIYMFTGQVYIAATVMPETLHNVSIAFVDEDDSVLSNRIISAFYPPQFKSPMLISLSAVDPGLDEGEYTFVLDIPPDFQNDLIAEKSPAIQLNVDATRMTQAFTGSGYIQQVVFGEVSEFVQGYRINTEPQVSLALRMRYNPNLEQSWFGALSEIINGLTMLSIILAGAALIREREHGTIEHLLVMPVTPIEIIAVQDLVHGSGRYYQRRNIADSSCTGFFKCPCTRFCFALPLCCSAVCCSHDFNRDLYGHCGAFNAPVRNAFTVGTAAVAAAFRRTYPSGEHAGVCSENYVGRAKHTLRCCRAGDPFQGCRY